MYSSVCSHFQDVQNELYIMVIVSYLENQASNEGFGLRDKKPYETPFLN